MLCCSSFGAATKSIGCWQFISTVGYGYVKICVICEIMSLLWFVAYSAFIYYINVVFKDFSSFSA